MLNIDKINVKNVIFDLDGTLIDSAPSILASIQVAFNTAGIEPAQPLTHDLIGPPLSVVMTSMLTDASLLELPLLIEAYKQHYDELGHRETRIYKGIPKMLKELRHLGLHLYIATNKRILPTRKIIENFGWTALFDGIYSLDFFKPALQNKTTMLKRLYQDLPGISDRSIYVGDRAEDAQAAIINRLCFLGASWGYGARELEAFGYARANNPEQLTKIIKWKLRKK
jgi:phosphoglycolate phosphatase